MQVYTHDYVQHKIQGPMNTVWPLMSSSGVDHTDMKDYLVGRGLEFELAEQNGWYPSREAMDSFLRIVIPARTPQPGHVYWQARAVSANVHIRYQTPKGPRHGALILVRAFPGNEVGDEPTEKIVIVEGPMDALAVAACGYDSIALMGMTPGKEATEHLIKLVDGRSSLVVLDNEPAAQSAAGHIALTLATAGTRSHIAKLHKVKDLAGLVVVARQAWLDTHMDNL